MAKAVTIHPKKLAGRWREGYALDYHSVSSVYIGDNQFGHPEFDTTRSAVGDLLYRLKYGRDQSTIDPLVGAATRFIRSWKPGADVIIPVPPSRARAMQPVMLLGEAIAKRLKLPFEPTWIKKTKKLPELKNVYDFDERSRLLADAHKVATSRVKDHIVLLFDDLYRSGATMNAIAEVLYDRGKVADVFAFTITKTRSNR
jgi:predicted amidophosphoribosyltransferase